MGGHGNVRWRSYDFVALRGGTEKQKSCIQYDISTHHAPFSVETLLGEVEWYREYVNIRERACQPATPVLQIGPVYNIQGRYLREELRMELTVSIESLSYLRSDIREQKGFVHGRL